MDHTQDPAQWCANRANRASRWYHYVSAAQVLRKAAQVGHKKPPFFRRGDGCSCCAFTF